MKRILTLTLLLIGSVSFSQSVNSLWKPHSESSTLKRSEKKDIPKKHLYDLDVKALRKILASAPKRNPKANSSNSIILLPNADGLFENFRVYENSVMEEKLASKYPEIKSYVAEGIENLGSRVYFSLSPLGFKSMTLHADKSAVFIEPYSSDLVTYTVYKKSDEPESLTKFECSVIYKTVTNKKRTTNYTARLGADDGKLRTLRLALSCTGEYTTHFGGTKALALAAMNNTMTRCNGIFETDFGLRLVLIANNDAVIYTSALTDPYSDASSISNWNTEVQTTLTSVIGEANYDIGHLFGGTGGGGNAGCIGCIGINGAKGSGYTSPSDGIPSGDNFDIDYVAHEMGHQLGANHTFTHSTESGSVAQMEPGSGSTIMGYAGITTKDVQPHSDAYFHAVSIQQVTNYIKGITCPTVTLTGNAVPVVNAGLDYTIPKGTPFKLNGSATDANSDDVLTYNWEEMDLGTSATSTPSATAIAGPIFRSYSSSTSATRYFPKMATVLAGLSTTAGIDIPLEVLPTVARTLNFRLSVRDNRVGGSANNTDDVIVTVNGTAGPFTVNSPNTAVTYTGGSTQTITWSVAGTTTNGVNCANVDVLLSTDGGLTFPITLLVATPNDGSENIVIPSIAGNKNRILIKGSNHIFFDVSDASFTISTSTSPDTTAPSSTTLTASGTTISATTLSWTAATDNIGVTGYDVYQGATLKGSTTTTTTFAVSGLTASTAYSFTVKAKDAAGNVSVASNTASITTLALADTTAPSVPTLTASGTTTSTTTLSWSTATDNVGVTGYDVYQNGVLKASTSATSYLVSGLSSSTTYSFYVLAKDAAGNSSLSSNSVTINTLMIDTIAPTPTALTASGTTTSATTLTWSTASDNVAVTGYDLYQNGVFKTSTTATTFVVSGLSPSTTYSFYIVANDASGNKSVNSNSVIVITLANIVSYCTSSGVSTTREYINRVQLGTINNLSGNNNGYGNFTSLSTNLALGSNNTITITPVWNGSVFSESYRVWIDLNQDGDFADSGEQVFNKSKTKSISVSGSFTIPTTAFLGTTRMRVSMKYNVFPTSCETFSYGEVEDYTVTITAAGKFEEASITKLSISLYPNPVKGDILNISNLEKPSDFRIYNMNGQELERNHIENNEIYVGSLSTGTYFIVVTDDNSTTTKRFVKE